MTVRFLFLLTLGSLVPTISHAQTSSASYEVELVRLAKEKSIATSRTWRNLLYYNFKLFTADKSLVDSKLFFLAKKGKTDPHAELEATIRAYFRPLEKYKKRPDDHPICRYPARLEYLTTILKIDHAKLPKATCPFMHKWRKNRGQYSGVSLVFTAYYPDNPSSMFGHTFLRLHKKNNEKSKALEILDDSINFAAYPDDSSGLTYAIRGLLGKFPGRYGYYHYFAKIQEYNNAEARDLWEYKLNLTDTEIERLLLALWEIAPHHSDYFFFDENCSFVLLTLLEVAKPGLDLSHQFSMWVLPVDTLRAVTETPGMVKNVSFRPSSLRRFLDRYKLLTPDEKELVEEAIETKNIAAFFQKLAKLPQAAQGKVLDAIVEYIDFKEKIAGTRIPKKYPQLRIRTLTERAKLKYVSSPLATVPEAERPDLGHKSNRLGLALARRSTNPIFDFYWRPAMHDLMADRTGFPVGLEIDFWDVHIRYLPTENIAYFESFSLLRILSLPPLEPIVKSFAWELQLGARSIWSCGDSEEERCLNYFVEGGVGQAFGLFDGFLTPFTLLKAEIGSSGEKGQSIYIGPVLNPGILIRAPYKINGIISANFKWQYGGVPTYNPNANAAVGYTFSNAWETRLFAAWQRNFAASGLQVYYYF